MEAFLDGKDTPVSTCGGGPLYSPRVRFGAAGIEAQEKATLAVVPFFNRSDRRGAGEAVSLEFVRQLVATGRFRVLEPGVVRDYLLRAGVIMPGGVSLETSRLMLGALGVNHILSGVVLDFREIGGKQGSVINFTATLLEGGTGEVMWHSTSSNRGDDGVFFFDLGRIATSGDLTCRMVGGVVTRLVAAARPAR
jgi:hypothetical protein